MLSPQEAQTQDTRYNVPLLNAFSFYVGVKVSYRTLFFTCISLHWSCLFTCKHPYPTMALSNANKASSPIISAQTSFLLLWCCFQYQRSSCEGLPTAQISRLIYSIISLEYQIQQGSSVLLETGYQLLELYDGFCNSFIISVWSHLELLLIVLWHLITTHREWITLLFTGD